MIDVNQCPPIGHEVIYAITHSDTGRKYVGRTKNSAAERLKGHLAAAVGGWSHARWDELERIVKGTYVPSTDRPHLRLRLYVAMKDAPREKFSVEVLEVCPAIDAPIREKYWIRRLCTGDPSKGYNKWGSHASEEPTTRKRDGLSGMPTPCGPMRQYNVGRYKARRSVVIGS
jgi:hypothetical protein